MSYGLTAFTETGAERFSINSRLFRLISVHEVYIPPNIAGHWETVNFPSIYNDGTWFILAEVPLFVTKIFTNYFQYYAHNVGVGVNVKYYICRL